MEALQHDKTVLKHEGSLASKQDQLNKHKELIAGQGDLMRDPSQFGKHLAAASMHMYFDEDSWSDQAHFMLEHQDKFPPDVIELVLNKYKERYAFYGKVLERFGA